MVNITDVKQILQFAIDAEIKVFLVSILMGLGKKEVTFVYQKLLLFLSKPQAWYIITL